MIQLIFDVAKTLNTAHFVLDGHCVVDGMGHNEYDLWCFPPEENSDKELYEYRWVREKRANYEWTLSFLYNLCANYASHWGREHIVSSSGLLTLLNETPYNMPVGPFMDGISELPETFAFPAINHNTAVIEEKNFEE